MADVSDVRNRLLIQAINRKIEQHAEILSGKNLEEVRCNLERGEREVRAYIQRAVDGAATRLRHEA